MKRSVLNCFVFLFLILFTGNSFAQKDSTAITTEDAKAMFDEAEFYFGDGNYMRALPLYQKVANAFPTEMVFRYKLGICYLYKSDEKEKSITYLEEVHKTDPKAKDLLFYLGVAYHFNYKFDEALKYFNDFLATNPPVSKRVLANKYIENCKNGKILTQNKLKTEIKNLGPVVNSRYSEYVPVISTDESILIFTYRGPRSKGGLMDEKLRPAADGDYYEDIFITQRVGSDWLSPESIGDNINTKGHDACIALSADGQKLFIYKSTPKDQGDIYMSYLDGEVWSKPERLGPTINTKYWEGSVSMSSDEQTLYFASERPGGLGKRDIWLAKKLENGAWGEAINMGEKINTSLNEDAPFIHPDGVTLFFSSEGHNSIGGYDIMYSTFENGEWSTPVDLEYPINTTEDDRFYVLSADGERGYFSSDRKGGKGQQDIYVVSPGIQGEKPVLALVVGIANGNNKAVDATINVYNAETDKKVGTYKANSNSGKYIIALSPGNKYKIAIEYEGMEPHIEYVDLRSLDTFVKAKQDFKLYSAEYKLANNIKDDTSSSGLEGKISFEVENLKKTDKTAANQLYEEQIYQTVLKKYGETAEDSVEYLVELGSYEDPADFNPSKVIALGKIEGKTNTDGSTGFTMGPFKTLLDAEIFKYKVLKSDSSFKKTIDIIVNDHGKTTAIPQYFKAEYSERSYTPVQKKPVKSKYNLTPEKAEAKEEEQIIRQHSNETNEGLQYKLEIASVKDTTQFNLGRLSKFGKIESKLYPDGYTRYTMGPFSTLAEVEAFKKKMEESDTAAASSFVTVFSFGQRKSLIEQFKNPPPPSAKKDSIAPPPPPPPAEAKKEEPEPEKAAPSKLGEKSTPPTPQPPPPPTPVVEVEAKPEPVKTEPVHKDSIVEKPVVVEQAPAPPPVTTPPPVVEAEAKPAPAPSPCHPDSAIDFTFFAGKDLNDVVIYNQLVAKAGNICAEGLTYKVQIGAYRHPENFKYPKLAVFGLADIKPYPDGITRFTLKEFKTLKEAEEFRQKVIGKGTKDAWITAFVNGDRRMLQDIIAVNFYTKAVN